MARIGSAVAFALLLGALRFELLVRAGPGTLLLWGDPDVVEPTIGQMMRPGSALRDPFTGFQVTIGEYGTCRNGNPGPPRQRPLRLAVGDSFTFGEDVSDPIHRGAARPVASAT